jgi:DNA-binding HxlR family transcriptional regulator
MNYEGYSNEVPEQIKSVLKGIDSNVRLAIIVALMKKGKLSFSEMKELLDLNSSSLSSHLSILQDGGLVVNILGWNKNTYSYYTATDIAKAVLKSLFDLVVQFPKSSGPGPKNRISPMQSLKIWDQNADSSRQRSLIVSKSIDIAIDEQFASDVINSVQNYTSAN